MTSTDKPRVLLKSKNIQLLMEYCIENKLEFTVIPGAVNDEWEVEVNVKNLIKAVELGMFMKTNKFELAGQTLFPKIPVAKPVKKSKETAAIKLPNDLNDYTETESESAPEEKKNKTAAKTEEPGLGLDFSNE